MARLPFTGIHERSTDSGGRTPHEGGGVLPPYGEDWLQRVVDVNWSGGEIGAVFVSGDYCCFLRAATVPTITLDQTWVGLSSLMFSDGGGCYGSTYALIDNTPTFLMCGHGDNYTGTQWGGIIALSHDGTNWTTTYFSVEDWHVADLRADPRDGKFYARSVIGGSLVSDDGYTWTHLPDDDFWAHCPSNYADGNTGTNPDTGLTIIPADVFVDGFSCNCVAFCGGIWMAAGDGDFEVFGDDYSSVTLSSIDEGKTWQLVTSGKLGMHYGYAVFTIIGAPIGDF